MPCSDGREQWGSQSNCDEYKEKANKWEAAFCAMVNEVDRQYGEAVINGIFIHAQKNSGLDIKQLYDEHLKKDIERLEKDLKKYSHDELGMIKLILNKNEKI